MEMVIVTGMSGAGKSSAIDVFEDIGYYCVDNIPPILLPEFAKLSKNNEGMEKIAIVMDSRGGSLFNDFFYNIDLVKQSGVQVSVVFLDSTDSKLLRRYKETRRKHPLFDIVSGSTSSAITKERKLIEFIKSKCDYYIDTTDLLPMQLREKIISHFLLVKSDALSVKITSFGFKYGAPSDSDIMFDVRCLPNPFYIPELKKKTGLDSDVFDYVLSFDSSKKLIEKLSDLLLFSLPLYLEEGKNQLVVAVGCTGGKHRSITVARRLNEFLINSGYNSRLEHRDVDRR